MGSVENLLDANGAGFGLLDMLKLLPLMKAIEGLDSVSAAN
ncbi:MULTISPECIES: hypothetical protein [Rhodococcus]|uniref:Uncharacterized protein n=2 Tax=Rhodococcus TaxID=1827 RepID=A0A1H7HTQ9_9NOCA|nr:MULTISPECIES: hypothetical protein [Rhodococcus]SEK52460.1 hypothetical protein SAMN05444583_102193 [Rhodococcus maanshanensis]